MILYYLCQYYFLKNTNKLKKRIPLWLPYLQSAELINKKRVKFIYNGGEVECSPDELTSIMIYGSEIDLPLAIVDLICSAGVPIIIHRRNIASPIWISSTIRADKFDLLDLQLKFRRNITKSKYITRRLLEEKFKSMRWLIAIPDNQIKKGMSIDKMRNIEAQISRRYWAEYMKSLGIDGNRRSEESEIRVALDIASKYVAGILLRWICYHHLSPFHGFCHTPTDYPSLVYDLFEPYRAGIEKTVWQLFKDNLIPDKKQITSIVISALKNYQDEKVYTSTTRQIVTRHELYHGIVLSLRSYLIGDSPKFIVPIESKPNGGRPKKVNFKLYGRSAGKTDFWVEAKKLQ